MSGFENLKREISETRAAVAALAATVASVVRRIKSIADQLANAPNDAALEVLAAELNGEQERLAEVGAALEAAAPVTDSEPEPEPKPTHADVPDGE